MQLPDDPAEGSNISDARDPIAETVVVATAMWGHTEPLMTVPVEAITHPWLATIAGIIRDRVRRGLPVDPETTLRAVMADKTGRNSKEQWGKFVTDLTTRHVDFAATPYYAERIVRLAAARRLVGAAHDVSREMAGAMFYDDDARAQRAASMARTSIDEALSLFTGGGSVDTHTTSLADLVCEPEDPEDWVVPDLLERGDRLILTGFEGTGKSILTTQLALTVAGGIHPFTGDPIEKLDGGTMRVLIADVENTRRQLRRRLGWIAWVIDGIRRRHGMDPVNWGDAVQLIIRPEGVDLTKPAEIARLESACVSTSPDLLVAGPLYKLTGYNTHEEEGALQLLSALDHLRIRHNCALISEHHAGHAQNGQSRSTRPIGSSVMLRWPEFGLGIVRHQDGDPDEEHPSWVQVRRWRGAREERDWPHELRHGGRDRLPWVPTEEYWDAIAKPTGRV